jgi:hypothetical protein
MSAMPGINKFTAPFSHPSVEIRYKAYPNEAITTMAQRIRMSLFKLFIV